MATRRIQNGKRISHEEVTSADGRKLKIDLYLVKADRHQTRNGEKVEPFRAICDEIDLDMSGTDLAALTAKALETARTRSDVTWEPWLYLTVKGAEWRPAKDAGLFPDRNDHDQRTKTHMTIEVRVEATQLATIDGRPKWRNPPTKERPAPEVRDGSPSVGRTERYRWDSAENVYPMKSLIRDTPENRAALVQLRKSFHELEDSLSALFSPETVEATFGSAIGMIGGVVGWVASKPTSPGRVRVKKAPPWPKECETLCEGCGVECRSAPRTAKPNVTEGYLGAIARAGAESRGGGDPYLAGILAKTEGKDPLTIPVVVEEGELPLYGDAKPVGRVRRRKG